MKERVTLGRCLLHDLLVDVHAVLDLDGLEVGEDALPNIYTEILCDLASSAEISDWTFILSEHFAAILWYRCSRTTFLFTESVLPLIISPL
jgi:hypothetical protein